MILLAFIHSLLSSHFLALLLPEREREREREKEREEREQAAEHTHSLYHLTATAGGTEVDLVSPHSHSALTALCREVEDTQSQEMNKTRLTI